MQPAFGALQMLIVFAVVCAALVACGFVWLYEIGHRETLPAFFNTWGGFEILIPILIAGMVFTIMFPTLFFLHHLQHTFGWTEAGLSLGTAVGGVLGVWAIRAVQPRGVPPQIVVSNPPGIPDGPTPDPRPQRPSGASGRRLRKAA
mgnify:CR=1 FL=1